MGVVNELRLHSMAAFHYERNRNNATSCVTDRRGSGSHVNVVHRVHKHQQIMAKSGCD
jgi:hypothetical protein